MKRKILSWLLVFSMILTTLSGTVVDVAAKVASSYGYEETDADSVKVHVTISNDGMPIMGKDADSTVVSHLEVEVPYFDLAKYDLGEYYRYGTTGGQGDYTNTTLIKRPTVLHLYIYLLERYYMGLPVEQCGQGKASGVLDYNNVSDVLYMNGEKAYNTTGYGAFSCSGSATSFYMTGFWGHDENLMYYRNHRYPLMKSGWGATADYMLLSEGDHIDLAMFSNWNFYSAGAFLSFDEDEYTAVTGSSLTVTTRKTSTSAGLEGSETPVEVYTEDVSIALYDSDWNKVNTSIEGNGDGTYNITMPDKTGTYYVMANDINAMTEDSAMAPATAEITVKEPEKIYEVTMKVAPTTAEVTFYEGANADKALAPAAVSDCGVVGNYHQYILNVPKGTYSYRGTEDGTDLGGMTFEVPFDEEIMGNGAASGKGLQLTLVRANYYTTKKDVVSKTGDYELRLMPGSLPDAVCGQQYVNDRGYVVTPVLLTARGNALVYNGTITLKGDIAETYGVSPIVNATFSDSLKAATNKTFSLATIETYTITAPTGASVQMFNQLKNFNVQELKPKSIDESTTGAVTYTFKNAKSANLTYRVSMEGKMTRAGYLKNTGQDIDISFDENENPKSTENIMENKNLQKRIESSTMLNVNGQNDLKLALNDTFRLRAYRGAWQIINSDTANIMIEPDFHYEILEGEEYVDISPVTKICTGNAKNNWLDIRGVKKGTAIVEVSYDAISIGGDGTLYDGQYGATAPYRSSLFVINVGSGENTLSMTADGSANTWDTEYDTVYFTEDTGSLTFTATVDEVTPAVVELSVDKGKTWREVSFSDGKFTADGLVAGNNILRFMQGNKTEYQVVRAAKVSYTVENLTREGDTIYEGDTLNIVFHGMYTPISKFSGIYNPGFGQGHKVSYTLPEGCSATASGGQYDFISTNKYNVTLDTFGKVTLTGGHVAFNVMGVANPLGGHRLLTDAGAGTNFSAVSTQHTRGVLPKLTFDVAELPSLPVNITTNVTNAAIVVTDEDGNECVTFAGVHTLDWGNYSYVVKAQGYVIERGGFTVSAADGNDKDVVINLRKLDDTDWDGSTVTEVSPNAAGIYELSTGNELAWFAKQVNSGNGVSWNAKLTGDISLGGFDWTPINGYKGTFDGNGHVVTDLYVNATTVNQGFFGTLQTNGVIKNLGVSGQVISTNNSVGGIVGRTYTTTTVENCYSDVEVTGKQNAGGIVGCQQPTSSKIINCYNLGNVTATSKLAGGISGGSTTSSLIMYIENCYSVGKVITPLNGGALVGSTKSSEVHNSYYLKGTYAGTSNAGTAKSEDELKAIASTLGKVYVTDLLGKNAGYPVLEWQLTEEEKEKIKELEAMAEALQAAKITAKEALAGYKNADDYREAQKKELAAAITAGNAAIDAAKTVEDVQAALTMAKATLDVIKTDAQLKEEESAKPSQEPGTAPSATPSTTPSQAPSTAPDTKPSTTPSQAPDTKPSTTPSQEPSTAPGATPDTKPSTTPSATPSQAPSTTPSQVPSATPDTTPSMTPSQVPSATPDTTSSMTPSVKPSTVPDKEVTTEVIRKDDGTVIEKLTEKITNTDGSTKTTITNTVTNPDGSVFKKETVILSETDEKGNVVTKTSVKDEKKDVSGNSIEIYEYSDQILPEDVEWNLSIVDKPEDAEKELLKENGAADYVLYDITPMSQGKAVDLTKGSVKVSIFCGDKWKGKNVKVFDFENQLWIDAVAEGEYVTFYATHFSKYAITQISDVKKGDVDLDGDVDLTDAQAALKAALKIHNLTGNAILAADADGNGIVELKDAQKILKVALKIEEF